MLTPDGNTAVTSAGIHLEILEVLANLDGEEDRRIGNEAKVLENCAKKAESHPEFGHRTATASPKPFIGNIPGK